MRDLLLVLVGLAAGLAGQTITVTPSAETVSTGKSKQFTANAIVTWSVDGVAGGNATVGTITNAGLYMAPMALPAPNPVTITATSVMNPMVSGTASITVRLTGPVVSSVTPGTFPAGSFSVILNGSGFQPGVVAYNGAAPLATTYLSPTQVRADGVAAPGNAFFRAQNPGTAFSAVVTVSVTAYPGSGGSTVTVAPLVMLGGTQQFSSNSTVTWSVTGAGTVSASGLYTAPVVMPTGGTATVVATGAGGATAAATVTLMSNVPPVVSGVTPAPIPLGAYAVTVGGTGFVPQAVVVMDGAVLPTKFVSATQLTAYGAALANGTGTVMVKQGPLTSNGATVQFGAASPLISAAGARRLLQQAAFGPSPSDVTLVQQLGAAGYLQQQMNAPKVSNYQGIAGNQGLGMSVRFLTNAVTNPDQLRQRVAFALEQIFVVSQNKLIWFSSAIPYHEMMLGNAFGNFRQILNDVTLSPAMGYYLDMANNGRGNAAGTTLPNENYAREVLQLFSIGTAKLNSDGTLYTGVAVPAYTQTTIAQFARVFTGWTNAPTTAGGPVVWGSYINPNAPMMAYAPMHDPGAKTLLDGVVLPAGQTAQKDLDDALDNLFLHPNVGPFIGKQLIQHLVKSNPSPAYVGRVAAAFANNGQGVRGDMKAVIAAVLLDPEARANDDAVLVSAADGHLQEPALYVAGFLRAFGAVVNDQHYLASDLAAMGQDVFNPPSVFNFYKPESLAPGTSLTGGEFQIYTPPAAIHRANVVANLFNAYNNPVQTYGPGTSIDLTAYTSLAGAPGLLADAVDAALFRGKMPASLKQTIVTAVQNDGGGAVRQTQTAIYLALLSGYYNVWN
jgi:uncharacterized protein (DUF1800 family)